MMIRATVLRYKQDKWKDNECGETNIEHSLIYNILDDAIVSRRRRVHAVSLQRENRLSPVTYDMHKCTHRPANTCTHVQCAYKHTHSGHADAAEKSRRARAKQTFHTPATHRQIGIERRSIHGQQRNSEKKTVCFCFLFISIFLYLFLSLLLPLAHSIHRCSSSASTFSELFPNRKKNVYSQFIMIWLIRFCPIAPLIFVLHHIRHTSNNEIRTPYIYLFDMFKKC